ncbi:hypothetical protein BH10ACT10_BH10ACT10_27220 [soil metagenome]
MSYQPLPPPPGGPPYPPGPPPKQGHVVELLVGAILGGILLVVSGVLGLTLMGTTDNGVVFFAGPVLGLALPVVLMTRPATKWWGVGLLIGFFLALIVLGGACVALIVGLSG